MKVSIIGVGLMGGSLGMALRKSLNAFVKGVVRSKETGVRALEVGALDAWSLSLREGVEDADYVFFATPVKSIGALFREAQPFIKKGALVSDLGSTKRSIVREITSTLREDLAFIGGHPMTGSDKRGVEHARADLYEGAPYILTPVSPFDRDRVEELIHIVKAIGARPYVLSPEEHDLTVALISHLPYVLSVSLVELVSRESSTRELIAGNFRDLTRPASSDPIMWRDIVSDNKDFIRKRIKEVLEFAIQILNMEESDLEELFKRIKTEREEILSKRFGPKDRNPKA